MMAVYEYLKPLIQVFVMFALAVLLARIAERKWPLAAKLPAAEYVVDLKLSSLTIFLNWLLGPLTGACAMTIVRLTGGGLIELRADGWWFPVSLAAIILTLDFTSYWLHRAQHAVPAFWAMHSLHHSAEALTVVTGARHFWFENVIQVGLLPFMAVLYKIPPIFVMIVPLIYFLPDGCAHLNVRLQLGRFSLWLNNPQYHRIHHSVQPEHWNKNFCKMLPLFDIIFGTAWKPEPDEFPATGLVPSEKPSGLLEGFIWPIRQWGPVRYCLNVSVPIMDSAIGSTHSYWTPDAVSAPSIVTGGERDAYRPVRPIGEKGTQPS